MKRTATRRLLAALLTAVLLAGLLPALSLTAGARAPQKVNASSADELKSYLESDTDYDITLTAEIDKYIGETEVWCYVSGNKRLDMNGHDLYIHQNDGKGVSYLFYIYPSANMTVYDSVNPGTKSSIYYRATIRNEILTGTYPYWRHLFSVYGKLTVNNVRCIAGRAIQRYNSYYAKDIRQQTYGKAVDIHSGGYLEVNGGYFEGHAYPVKPREDPVIDVNNGAEVSFNFGEVHGLSQADCFKVRSGAAVRVASGIFESDYYSEVWWGLPKEAYKIEYPGQVGLKESHLADGCARFIESTGNTETTNALFVYTRATQCNLQAASGDSQVIDGATHFRLLKSNPVLKAVTLEPYFRLADDDSPMAPHGYTSQWEIYDGTTLAAKSPLYTTVKDLNVMTAFSGFTPELGKEYRVRCQVEEYVKPNQYGAVSKYYYLDHYFLVTESVSAPIIQKKLPSSAVFQVGGTFSLSIRASGSGLSYQWYALDPSRPTRPEAISGQNTGTLTISNARKTLDGAYIYCVVSNSAGSIKSNLCKLSANQTVVTEIPILNLEQPKHGVPLDTSVDIDVPGLKLDRFSWGRIGADYAYKQLTDAELNNPIAGQLLYCRAEIQYDNTVVMDRGVKATALGTVSTLVSSPLDYEKWFYIPFTVQADGTLEVDSVSLSFGDGALTVGEKAPALEIANCGFSTLDAEYHIVTDTRYSIQSQKWFVDGVEADDPTVEQGHTYTLKVRLLPKGDWKLTKDTDVYVDGEAVPAAFDTFTVGKDRYTSVTFELEFDTKEGDPGEDYQEYDLLIEGVQVTSKNRTDVLGNGLFFFDGEKTLAVRGSYTGGTDIITNKGVDGLIIRMEEDSVLSTGKYDQPIALEASAVITGPGKLTLSGGDSGIFVRSKNATLTIRNVNMDVQCRWGIGSTTAANSSKLVIDRANIKVDTDKGAICDFGGGITITNCKILRPEGVGISDDGKSITDAEDAYAKSVEIGAAALLPEVVYTPDSRSVVGGKLTVFIEYMAEASDELMEAYLADEVKYQWYCAGEPIPGATEETLELTGAQKGKSVYVVVSFNGNTIESEYSTVHAPAMPFADVAGGAYYYDAVLWAVNHEPQITNGTDAAHFSPDRTCTRGQVVTFLWRAVGEPEPASTANPFTDVKEGQYFYKAVLWAVEQGVTKGVSPTAFGPDRGCTRGQVVTFLWRAEGQPEPAAADNPFTDVKEGQYYYKAVLWAVEQGITKGTGPDKFSPDATCTRGQIVTFLYRDMG